MQSPTGSSGNGNGYKTTKQTLKELRKEIEEIGFGSQVTLAKKVEPGVVKVDDVILESNVFGVRLPEREIYRYDVAIEAVTKRNRILHLEKLARDDYLVTERKRRCVEVFKSLRDHKFFSQPGQVIYYDGQKMLYALVRLPMNGDKRHLFKVDPNKVYLGMDNIADINFIISEVFEDFEFTLNDLSRIAKRNGRTDRTILQFIDIATSQNVILDAESHISFRGGVSYLKNPTSAGFAKESCPKIGEGKEILIGVHKAACLIEGPRGRGSNSVGIIIDTAKAAFHKRQNAMEKALEIFPNLMKTKVTLIQLRMLKKQFRGLYAETVLNGKTGTVFQIMEVISKSAREMTFLYHNNEISVEQYYQYKYDVQLKFPGAPLLTSRRGSQINFFPLEISYIISGQRVQQFQQTSCQLKDMKQACIITPQQRVDENLMNTNALGILEKNNPWLAEAGIEIKRPLKMVSRILPVPSIQYKNGTENINPLSVGWSMKSGAMYICPAKVKLWALYVIKHNKNSDTINQQDMRKFIELYIKACKSRGMVIDVPAHTDFVSAEPEAVEECIKTAAENNAEFVFFIQEDSVTLHDFIKSMERKYLIITQDMKVSRALDVIYKGKWQTLENVVHKTNIKLGGVNYELCPNSIPTLHWLKPGRLFIGFAFSHAGPPTKAELARREPSRPIVVGYAANIDFVDFAFVGDFGYHDPRRNDIVSVVAKFVSRAVERYFVTKKNYPSQLIIYRGGVSEGEFTVVTNYEVPLIRRALENSPCGAVSLTLIVVTRMHQIRLMPHGADDRKIRVNEQNIKAGCVVDEQLVHPRYNEFYLNSHKTFQGTAKTPRYTVLVDDNEFTMDDLEGMTYWLCFCHQIVTLTTSLPTPLYVAGLYAERGRRLLQQWSGNDDSSGGDFGELIDLEGANDVIPYEGTKLSMCRINA